MLIDIFSFHSVSTNTIHDTISAYSDPSIGHAILPSGQ
jgi:hypothetical protein